MRIIMIGPPGSGKGTQAAFMRKRLNVPSVSTGNILRAEIAAGSEVGKKAGEFVSKGELVPDDIILKIVERRLSQPDCENGFILDGFPRTAAQAEALERGGVKIDFVVMMNVSDEEIIRRMAGRRVCGDCGGSFHITDRPPEKEGVCDTCGGGLFIRDDDAPETVKRRLDTYRKNTAPLLDYYKDILKTVENRGSIDKNAEAVAKALGV